MAVTCPSATSAALMELAASAALTACRRSDGNSHVFVRQQASLAKPQGKLARAQFVETMPIQLMLSMYSRRRHVKPFRKGALSLHPEFTHGDMGFAAFMGKVVHSRTAVRRAVCASTSSSLAATSA